MGMMKFDVPHTLSAEDAKKRVEALLAYWKSKYGVNSTWNGDKATMNGKVMGITIEATMHVGAGKIAGEGKDPGMLFRGQATKYITHKFGQYLDASKTLDEIGKRED